MKFDLPAQLDVDSHIIAGRRAAAMAIVGSSPALRFWGAQTPETVDRLSSLCVHGGIDVGPGIDAAVMETIVRLRNPESAPDTMRVRFRKVRRWLAERVARRESQPS